MRHFSFWRPILAIVSASSRSQGGRQWMSVRVPAGVDKIEGEVEFTVSLALGVLQDRFQLVERLGELSFRRGGLVVVVPQIEKVPPQRQRQGGDELLGILSFLSRFEHARLLIGSRNVAADRLPQIMQNADFQQLQQIHVGKQVGEDDRKQRQLPGVFGAAFGSSGGGSAAAEGVLQSLCGAEEGETVAQLLFVHGEAV